MEKKAIYIGGFAILLLVILLVARKFRKNHVPAIKLPDISLQDLQGHDIDLRNYSGKPLVINFWGTWCGPCREELPFFEKASVKYRDKVSFLVASDEAVEKLTNFKNDNSYTFTYAVSTKSFQQLGITSVPFTYFYDSKGNILYTIKDALGEKELNTLVEQLTRK